MIKKIKKWSNHFFFKNSDKIYKENQKLFLNYFDNDSNNKKKIRLLDLGCGDGSFTQKIAQKLKTKDIFGIEIDKNYLKKAKKRGVKVVKSDLNQRFPFPAGYFDVVSANQIIEHLWNTDNFFKEIRRVLKRGGYAVISTPNLSSFHSIFFILLGYQSPVIHFTKVQVGNPLKGIEAYGHQKAFNIFALRDLSEYYGFKIEKIEGFGFYFFPLFIQRLFSKILSRYAVYLTIKIRKI